MYDLVIEGGTVVDGSGSASYIGSVYLRSDRIALIQAEDSASQAADEHVDARGKIVAPGFVDVHTHYDAQAFWDPVLSPSPFHGVTTVIGGNCGFTIAPLSDDSADAQYLKRMLARVEGMPLESLDGGVPWGTWKSFADYLGCLDNTLAVNAGFLVGHSALRRTVMGERANSDEANATDLKKMTALLRESLSAGGLGFSSTLSPTHNDMEGNPVPSRFANQAELLALSGVCRDFPGTVLEFLPGTKEFDENAYQLMTSMSLAAQRPLNWNLYVPGMPAMDKSQLGATDYARARGADVIALTPAQPVITRINLHSAFIFDAFHGWEETMRLPIPERIVALKDPQTRRKLNEGAHAEESGVFVFMAGWAGYTVDEVALEKNKNLEGRKIGDIAAEQGKEPFDTLLDLAIEENLKTSFIPLLYGDDDFSWNTRVRAWGDSRTVVGASDAGAHLDMIDTFSFSTQMLGNAVSKRRLLSVEKAVHYLTEVPAKLVGLKERGLLKEGYCADIVVFDLDTVACSDTYTRRDLPGGAGRLYADAHGIEHVFVNGREIIRHNTFTGALPGKILRSGTDTATVAMPGDYS
ncbi:MAG TPA: amidohydrolase family protein [Halioglobus sp.]